MTFRLPPDYLTISQAAAAAFAGARLLQFGMRRRFPFLFSYLVFVSLYYVVISLLKPASDAYYWVYLICEPMIWCAAALAVREMFALVFRDYPGLRTAGRWALYVALAISAIASLLVVNAPRPVESPGSYRLFCEEVFDRSAHFGLAVIILILLMFLSRYPLRLDRNTYVASGFFSAMFLAQSLVRLADSFSTQLFVHAADYPEVGFAAMCFLGWGMMLVPAKTVAPQRVQANKPRETELLQQLESLNSILSRSVRR